MNVRIFFNPLDAKSEKVYQVPVGTQIIEFLQDEFPSGFNAPVRIFAAQNELDPDDWDHVIAEEERITILLMPAATLGIGFASAVGTALLKAAIAVAIGYIINLIFKPKAPSDLNDGDTSPVYSIGATRNQQRLGAPIEVLYGSVLYPPSFASAPYVYNVQDTNDQYVDELLCLGHGMFAIEDIYVGNTPVSAMEVDTVKYWLIDSTEHNNKQSNVEDIVNADVINSSNPLPFYSNMYTSPEVSDLDFKSGETESTTGPVAFAGDANGASLDLSGNPILGNISGVDSSINIQTGDRLTLAGTTSNNIEFTVGSIVVDPTNPLLMTIFQRANDSAKISTEIPLAPTPTYQINQTVVNYRFGPYRAQREGDVVTEIWCDFTFPQGLYSVDGTDGDIDPAAYSLKFTYQEIDENGDDLPGGTQHSFTYEFKTTSRSPYRGSVSSGPLTPGFYNVTVERDGSFNDQRVVEVCQWSGMRSAIQLDPLLESYSDTTLLAIRMKASNGLGQAAQERVRVRATRVLMEGGIVGDFTIGNNGADIYGAQTAADEASPPEYGLLTGPLTRLIGINDVSFPNLIIAGTTPRGEYGGQPSLDVTVPDYSTTPITLNYQPATLDYRTTDAAFTAWLVANDGLATTYEVWNPSTESSNPITALKDIWTNRVYGLGRPLAGLDLATMDALESDWAGGYPQPEFNAVFAERGTGYDAMQTIASMCGGNIVQDGGLVTIAFDQVQDVRAALFSSANIVRDSLNILYTFNTDGEYDSVQVEYRDPSTWDVAYVVYPPEGIDHDTYNLFGCTDETYATEMATYLWNVRARRRKQVKFQTELEGLIPVFNDRIGVSHPLPQWGQSGVFVQQISATEWFVDQDLDWTTDNVMIIRSEVGTGSPLYTVTQGASPNIVVFEQEPVGLIATAELREPTNYMFGVADELIKDFQVTKVSPSSDNIIAIEAQTYDELIYNGAPPHMGGPCGVCEVYSPTSYFDWLTDYNTNVDVVSLWLFDEAQGSTVAVDTFGRTNLNNSSGGFGGDNLIDDGRSVFNGGSGVNQNPSGGLNDMTPLKGTLSCIVKEDPGKIETVADISFPYSGTLIRNRISISAQLAKGLQIFVNGQGQLDWEVFLPDVLTGDLCGLGGTHIAIVYECFPDEFSGTTTISLDVYINFVLYDSYPDAWASTVFQAVTADVRFGGNSATSTYIADAAHFKQKLTANQIAAIGDALARNCAGYQQDCQPCDSVIPPGGTVDSLINFADYPVGTPPIVDEGVEALPWAYAGAASIIADPEGLAGNRLQIPINSRLWVSEANMPSAMSDKYATGDWTIECKIKLDDSVSTRAKAILEWRISGEVEGIVWRVDSDETTISTYVGSPTGAGWEIFYTVDPPSINPAVEIVFELALVKKGPSVLTFVDGVFYERISGKLSDPYFDISTVNPLNLGNSTDNVSDMSGEFLRFRMTSGVAKYNANGYTPEPGDSYL